MPIPEPISGVLDIAPYVGGDAKAEGTAETVKLSSNEGALGASPKAMAAFRAEAETLHRYPDGGANRLRDTIAEAHGLHPAQIICGNGSDEIIGTLVRAYCGAGDTLVYSAHGFLMYPIAAMAAGAKPVAAAEIDYRADVSALLAAVTPQTKMLFIANPNNPTGTYLSSEELRLLQRELPPHVLMVIDSAYAEYVSKNDYSAGIELVSDMDNVVMTRTFSKIHGLAALRLGWAYCPPAVADVYHRVRGPFNVNSAAQAAGIAAIGDTAHVDASRAHNGTWLPRLTEAFERHGLKVLPSVGNFISVAFPDAANRNASAAQAFLKEQGILPRNIAAYKMPGFLRFTVGTEPENLALIAAVEAFMAGPSA